MLEQQALCEPFLSTSSVKGYSSCMSTSNTVATSVSADMKTDSFVGFMMLILAVLLGLCNLTMHFAPVKLWLFNEMAGSKST